MLEDNSNFTSEAFFGESLFFYGEEDFFFAGEVYFLAAGFILTSSAESISDSE